MDKQLKEKKKKLDKNHQDFMYEVLGFIRKQNLSKYAYYHFRDQVISDIYDGQENEETNDHIFKGGYETYWTRKLKNAPKKSVYEKIGAFLFAFFTLFFALASFIYIYRFPVPIPGIYYSQGIYLYVTASNLGTMFIYGFAGALLSIFIQKNDKKTKYILLAGTSAVGLITILVLFGIGSRYIVPFGINMVVVFIVCLVIALGGYFLEDIVSKKRCEKYKQNAQK